MIACAVVSAPQRHQLHQLAFRWLPVVAWMTLIFIASSDAESGPRGSRLLAPLLRWLMPDLGPETLEHIVFLARKGVHFVTFGVLAALSWRAFTTASSPHPGLPATRPRRHSPLLRSFLLTAAYAVSDELHQCFVPTRTGSVMDVAIDCAGALTALLVCGAWTRRRPPGR